MNICKCCYYYKEYIKKGEQHFLCSFENTYGYCDSFEKCEE